MAAALGHIVVFATHHKCATRLMHLAGERLARELSVPFVTCDPADILSERIYSRLDKPCILHDTHSYLDVTRVKQPVRAIHFIRDPRELVVSGYLYHLKCSEEWCLRPDEKYSGISYQELLRSKSREEGLMLEIELVAKTTLQDMLRWQDPPVPFIEIKCEDILERYDETLKKLLEFALNGSPPELITRCLGVVEPFDLKRQSRQEREGNGHVTNYELTPGRWQNYLGPQHLALLMHYCSQFMVSKGYI